MRWERVPIFGSLSCTYSSVSHCRLEGFASRAVSSSSWPSLLSRQPQMVDIGVSCNSAKGKERAVERQYVKQLVVSLLYIHTDIYGEVNF